jgi:hypothetical protein
MTDTRQGLAGAARALADLAKEATYLAIGVGVLEYQKAQVRRREIASARKLMAKRAKDIDATVAQLIRVVDSTGARAASRTSAGIRPPGPRGTRWDPDTRVRFHRLNQQRRPRQ